jgi:hypothetical protein
LEALPPKSNPTEGPCQYTFIGSAFLRISQPSP